MSNNPIEAHERSENAERWIIQHKNINLPS